jgi:hypothetical protein
MVSQESCYEDLVYHGIRKDIPYETYPEIDFPIFLGHNGDCFDRYLVRITKCVLVKNFRAGINNIGLENIS